MTIRSMISLVLFTYIISGVLGHSYAVDQREIDYCVGVLV